MGHAADLIEIWRGDRLESAHVGHVVVCGPSGEVVASWGDPKAVIYPRSSAKMIQALPLMMSPLAPHLSTAQRAVICASHSGGRIHVDLVTRWLSELGLAEDALRCGVQWPSDEPERDSLIKTDKSPCKIHNNCSGKHAGFLALSQHMGAGPEYVDPDHPLQLKIKAHFEEVTQEASPGFGIDGCSAPNFATTVEGLARAMARFAVAQEGTRDGRAMIALHEAMRAHPDLVAGEGRACTELMCACPGAAIKTGAEGVYVGILPQARLGIALKIRDGATRAAEAAITHLLTRYAGLDPKDPAAQKRLGPITNWDGLRTGEVRLAAGFA